jgi:putative phosphoribosyl transferase
MRRDYSHIAEDQAIPVDDVILKGDLVVPKRARGLVVFAHGSGSSRHSIRNRYVARQIQETGAGTLLFDLLTREEEWSEQLTGHLRFDIALLTQRLLGTLAWLKARPDTAPLRIGLFGSSTGGAAALMAAAAAPESIGAVVSRGGRPDLAMRALPEVRAATLLLVGGEDKEVLRLNELAFAQLRCKKELGVIPGATHLFEEVGTLEDVADRAAKWFQRYLSDEQPDLRKIA